MKVKYTLLGLVALIGGMVFSRNVSSLSYEDEVDLYFTFDTALTVNVSSNNVTISDLVPGTADYSNTAIITVSTNSSSGYSLFASVSGGTANYSDAHLHLETDSSVTISSLATGDSLLLAEFVDDRWGYTTATSVTSGAVYSGLGYSVSKRINKTTDISGTAASGYPGTNITSFTIGAKVSSVKAAGTYANTLTFTAVAN